MTVAPHTITLTDSGPGIAKEDRTRVFERFARGKNATASGSGLGLSIVHEICSKLGITITLATPENHSGLKVILRFPNKLSK